jgi:hypothetical protein
LTINLRLVFGSMEANQGKDGTLTDAAGGGVRKDAFT